MHDGSLSETHSPRRPRVYLAGPAVFRPDAVEIGRAQVALCAEFGFEGLYPLDNEIKGGDGPLDTLIYRGNMAMIRAADFGIFDLSPFQGIFADVGTAFELGAFAMAGKPAFAYTTSGATLLERAEQALDVHYVEGRGPIDPKTGNSIEDFGNADNLMLAAFLKESRNALVVADDTMSGVRRCLELAAEVVKPSEA